MSKIGKEKKKIKKKSRKILYTQLKTLEKESHTPVDGNELATISRAMAEIYRRL